MFYISIREGNQRKLQGRKLPYYCSHACRYRRQLYRRVRHPIIVFVFYYAGMARSLRRITKITQPASDAAQPIDPKISRARRNIIKTLFIVVLGFIICSSFKQFLVLSSILGDLRVDLSGATYNVGQFLSYVNCCNDPFIYGFIYEEFRVGLRKLFCRFQVKPSGSTTTNAETQNK